MLVVKTQIEHQDINIIIDNRDGGGIENIAKPKPYVGELKFGINVTCSEKRDHSGFFMKIEFLEWMDSLCILSTIVKVPRKNIDHKPSYDHFYALRFIASFSGK